MTQKGEENPQNANIVFFWLDASEQGPPVSQKVGNPSPLSMVTSFNGTLDTQGNPSLAFAWTSGSRQGDAHGAVAPLPGPLARIGSPDPNLGREYLAWRLKKKRTHQVLSYVSRHLQQPNKMQ